MLHLEAVVLVLQVLDAQALRLDLLHEEGGVDHLDRPGASAHAGHATCRGHDKGRSNTGTV